LKLFFLNLFFKLFSPPSWIPSLFGLTRVRKTRNPEGKLSKGDQRSNPKREIGRRTKFEDKRPRNTRNSVKNLKNSKIFSPETQVRNFLLHLSGGTEDFLRIFSNRVSALWASSASFRGGTRVGEENRMLKIFIKNFFSILSSFQTKDFVALSQRDNPASEENDFHGGEKRKIQFDVSNRNKVQYFFNFPSADCVSTPTGNPSSRVSYAASSRKEE
jgi:hypothetical protein